VKQKTKKQKESGTQQMTNVYTTLLYPMYNLGILGQFAQFLTYKVEKVGKRVIRIEYSLPSQQCYRCGKRIKRTLSECFITCDCGNGIDRDLNSAIPILESFINQKQHFYFLSHQPSMTEESFRERRDLLRNTVPSPQTGVDDELVVNGRLGIYICTQ
jgi:hypothetical protein